VLNTIDGQQITPSQVGTSSNRTDVVADTVDTNNLTGVSTGGGWDEIAIAQLPNVQSSDPIAFTSIVKDANNNMDTTTGEYVVPSDGLYFISAFIRARFSMGSKVSFRLNVGTDNIVNSNMKADVDGSDPMAMTSIAQATAGDRIRVENPDQVGMFGSSNRIAVAKILTP